MNKIIFALAFLVVELSFAGTWIIECVSEDNAYNLQISKVDGPRPEAAEAVISTSNVSYNMKCTTNSSLEHYTFGCENGKGAGSHSLVFQVIYGQPIYNGYFFRRNEPNKNADLISEFSNCKSNF